jgi:hypothetical protein
MTNQQHIDTLVTIRDMNRRAASELSERYSGVRPSWVSADLAIYWHRAEQAQMQIDKLDKINGAATLIRQLLGELEQRDDT